MRPITVATIVFLGLAPLVSAQTPVPRGYLYRGPFYANRVATPVEPENGMPLGFTSAMLQDGRLQATVQTRTVHAVPLSGITLRVAFGPTPSGMVTFRMRPILPAVMLPEPLRRLPPNSGPTPVPFHIVDEDPRPGPLALTPEMKVVFTLERLDGSDGYVLFENPNAIELLWEALGKPSLTRQ